MTFEEYLEKQSDYSLPSTILYLEIGERLTDLDIIENIIYADQGPPDERKLKHILMLVSIRIINKSVNKY